jgi:hypothetical protein
MDGHQVTMPDGTDPDDTGKLVDEFLWLDVRRARAVFPARTRVNERRRA